MRSELRCGKQLYADRSRRSSTPLSSRQPNRFDRRSMRDSILLNQFLKKQITKIAKAYEDHEEISSNSLGYLAGLILNASESAVPILPAASLAITRILAA